MAKGKNRDEQQPGEQLQQVPQADEQQNAIPLDVAEDEFQQFADNWGFKTESRYWDQDTVDGFNDHKERVVDALVDGRAVWDGELLTYTAEDGTELKFHRPGGKALLSMDSYKEKQSMHKLYQFIGHLTKTAPQLVAQLEGRDAKTVMGLASLFLGG